MEEKKGVGQKTKALGEEDWLSWGLPSLNISWFFDNAKVFAVVLGAFGLLGGTYFVLQGEQKRVVKKENIPSSIGPARGVAAENGMSGFQALIEENNRNRKFNRRYLKKKKKRGRIKRIRKGLK